MLPNTSVYTPKVIIVLPLFSTIQSFNIHKGTPYSLMCTTFHLAVLKMHHLPMSLATNIVISTTISQSDHFQTWASNQSMLLLLHQKYSFGPQGIWLDKDSLLTIIPTLAIMPFWWPVWFFNFPFPQPIQLNS